MKINIGSYHDDLIPVHGLLRKYETMRHGGIVFEDEYKWYDKVIINTLEVLDNLLKPINRWSNNRGRKIKIHIDNYDVWSADHTLAMIIHPVLVKLKEQKHGSPPVDDEDVPDNLKSSAASPKENKWDTDENYHARWEWVLDEMIWAYSQHGLEDDSYQFHHNSNQLQLVFKEAPDIKGSKELTFNHQKDPSKPPYWRDDEGLKKHTERKANGRRLFAKYYEALWD